MKRESGDSCCLFMRCLHWDFEPLGGGLGLLVSPPPFLGGDSIRKCLLPGLAQQHGY